MQSQTRSRGIALPYNVGARWGWVVNANPGRFTPGNDPVSSVYRAGWALRSVRTGAENITLFGIRSPGGFRP
jgi:hypothetical protein